MNRRPAGSERRLTRGTRCIQIARGRATSSTMLADRRGPEMGRRLQTPHHRPGPTPRGPTLRFAFGLRVALLAVLAQIVVNVVHQFPHDHRPSADAAAVEHETAAGHAHHGDHHEHGPSLPTNDPDPQLCVVGQMLQHLAAVLPVAGGSLLLPDWDTRQITVPGDTDAVVVRPDSPAQPRAPPRTA
jgi:hypothetical protein